MGKLFTRIFLISAVAIGFASCGTPDVTVTLSTPKIQTPDAKSICNAAVQANLCEQIAMIPAPVCNLSSFGDGTALPAQPVSESGANSCIATEKVDLDLCELGYSYQQIQAAKIDCN